MSIPAAVLGTAFAVSTAVVLVLRRHAGRLPQDAASERSLHQGRMPRGGGLAIVAGALLPLAIAAPALPGHPLAWLVAIAAVTAVSFADDVHGVRPLLRLVVQLAAGVLAASQLADGAGPVLAAALVVAWGANLFNFMDGSDGLAASMAITGFCAYSIAAGVAGLPWAPYAAVAVATIPFFAVNRPRASMFMGDVGAVPLGFAAAALGLAGIVSGTWPAWFPPLVFLPFLGDATITLALRLARAERVWEPHRSHFYQRLNTLGAGHRGTLAVYGASMLACAAFAIACLVIAPHAGPFALGVAIAVHLIGFAAIDYHDRRQKRLQPLPSGKPPRATR